MKREKRETALADIFDDCEGGAPAQFLRGWDYVMENLLERDPPLSQADSPHYLAGFWEGRGWMDLSLGKEEHTEETEAAALVRGALHYRQKRDDAARRGY